MSAQGSFHRSPASARLAVNEAHQEVQEEIRERQLGERFDAVDFGLDPWEDVYVGIDPFGGPPMDPRYNNLSPDPMDDLLDQILDDLLDLQYDEATDY